MSQSKPSDYTSSDSPTRSDSPQESNQKHHEYTPELEVTELPDNTHNPQLIIMDVRNEEDQDTNKAFGNRMITRLSTAHLYDFKHYAQTLDKDKEYILICYVGIRSYNLAKELQNAGISKAFSYAEGYEKLESLTDTPQ